MPGAQSDRRLTIPCPEFVPYLSMLDLLLNCGDEAPLIASGGMQ